ncbi:alcohol dehydrogenase catalytic domain-containing protein, partial [Salmonella enterica subsp. enterica serovar Anatum]|nr:alcohol dehydrogenase catalytic domain-containing protein [Salmonella enterica subsp. enterica serovar Anatum]
GTDIHAFAGRQPFFAYPRVLGHEICGVAEMLGKSCSTAKVGQANTLMAKEDFRIILAGGELRSRDGGIIGEATQDFIAQFRLDF